METKPSLIAEEVRRFDFGDVIGRTGQKMDHRYRLVNASPRDVKLLQIINRKSCCGIITVDKEVLHSGDAADVTVTLVVGDKFGGVTHETEVVTDLPSDPSIVLRTSATAHPAFRFEEISSSDEASQTDFRKPRRAEFRVVATGTPADPAADLDRLELRSTIKAEWAGAKVKGSSEDGLITESRPFVAWLDTTGPPGDRKAEILVSDGKTTLTNHVVAWEVTSPISVSPKILVIKAGTRDYQIVLQSRDRMPFRITGIDCNVAGITVRAATEAPAFTQIVKIERSSPTVKDRGSITASIDHPSMGKVELPFIVLD